MIEENGRGGRGLGALVVALVLLLVPAPVAGYVGPGAGLAAIGAAIALVGGVLLAVGGFVWYPFKRLARRLSGSTDDTGEDASG